MPFSFRSPAGGTHTAKKQKSLTSSTIVPLVRLNVVSTMFQVASWKFDHNSWNEIALPCIMLKQTNDPCPSLDVRFPNLYTFLTDLAVLPRRPGQLLAF